MRSFEHHGAAATRLLHLHLQPACRSDTSGGLYQRMRERSLENLTAVEPS